MVLQDVEVLGGQLLLLHALGTRNPKEVCEEGSEGNLLHLQTFDHTAPSAAAITAKVAWGCGPEELLAQQTSTQRAIPLHVGECTKHDEESSCDRY